MLSVMSGLCKLKFYLFADDTNIFYTADNLDDLQKTLNRELKKLTLWLNCNRLALNITKTNFVLFASVNKPLKNVTILLGRKAIAQKDFVKYIGVLIDSRLSFKAHISSITKKIARTIGLFYKLRYYMNQKTLIMIYNSLIYPYLIYATSIWGNACDSIINPIFILQKKAVKAITFSDVRTHSAPLFKLLNILTIHDIYKIETLKFVHDCLNKVNPCQFHTYYTYPDNSHYTTSSSQCKLYIPMVRTSTYGLKSLKYNGAIVWNDLPLTVRVVTSRKAFAKTLKSIFISIY